MKKFLTIFVVVIFAFGITSCKKVNVPKAVKTAFSQKYQGASHVSWEQKKDKTVKAEFKLKKVEMSALFNNKGLWLRTEKEIEIKAVPETVKKTLQARFSNYKVKETTYFETPTQSGYGIVLKLKNGEKIKALFDKNGKGLKREKVTDNE